MHRVRIAQSRGPAVFRQQSVTHHFRDIGQIPPQQIDGMRKPAIQPFQATIFRPVLFEKPAMIRVVMRFDGKKIAVLAGFEVGALAHHGLEEA